MTHKLLERASCYFCLQDWTAGIKDLGFILVFVPVHVKALLMRYAYILINTYLSLSVPLYTTENIKT